MKANRITIKRYRAFDKAVAIDLHGLTVLTGPNNLGKSTILLALRLFFASFSRELPPGFTRHFEIERDYPKKYEGRPGRKALTRISVNFQLSKEDILAAASEATVELPTEITVHAEFPADRNRVLLSTEPRLQNLAHRYLWSLISEKVRYVYIPTGRGLASGRNSERSDVQGEIARLALAKVKNTRARLKALEKLVEDAKNELVGLQDEFAAELRLYMPALKAIDFEISPPDPRQLVRVNDILIDDGAKTPLSQKGDGVKNLFAIAVLQYIAKQDPGDQLILGIEEPEAHLHSDAIYKLKPQLQHLSVQHQVLVTTHSPILVQRENIAKNLIVTQEEGTFTSSVREARSLADIRRSLGIKPQENMTTAEIVLIVEGETERRVCEALFREFDAKLRHALDEGRIRILAAQGAKKVIPLLRALVRDAASCAVLLDNDGEGRSAKSEILDGGLCAARDVFMVPNREGVSETEFEDLFAPSLYIDALGDACGISLTLEDLEDARRKSGGRQDKTKKWSIVVRRLLEKHGKSWDDLHESLRTRFADALVRNAAQVALNELPSIRDLASRLVVLLKEEGEAVASI